MGQSYLTGLHSEEGRRALAESLLGLLRRWGVEEADQARLLETVAPLWEGAALPDKSAVLERAGMLLAIDRALQRQFAEQPLMAERWVTMPNIWLKGRVPLETMLGGEEGIRQIHDHLPHHEGDYSPP